MEHGRKRKHPTSGYFYLNRCFSLFVYDLSPSVTIGFGYQGVDARRKNRLPIRELVYYEKYAEPKVQYSPWFTAAICSSHDLQFYSYSSKSVKLPLVVTKLNNRLPIAS